MAKSKSRRVRRQQSEKLSQPAATDQIVALTETEASAPAADAPRGPGRKTVNFGEEYFYVYREMRSILLVAVVMFVVMVGLAYLI
ncbi:MAG TPA: hypothetical protein PKE64_09870 [Anaerolineae bacterium]|nr:hypothetical protein [Anaerolineae bacterium]HMR64304.1 hypothetical protein [Anaerolineae bacterium]